MLLGQMEWLTPLMTTLAAIAAGYFAMVVQNKKLAFDAARVEDKAEMRVMRAEIERVTSEMTACYAERDSLRQEVRELRATCEKQQKQIEHLQAVTGSKHD